MTIAGIGCRKIVTSAEVIAAVDAALSAHGLSRTTLDALATIPLKREQLALHEAAAALGLPLLIPTDDAISTTGTPSASEAAALAAGSKMRLLGPRHILGNVTCAIAVSEEGL
jgi:cobalt-precorrin 5A hydrolase